MKHYPASTFSVRETREDLFRAPSRAKDKLLICAALAIILAAGLVEKLLP